MKTNRTGLRICTIAVAIAASAIFIGGQLSYGHAQQIAGNTSSGVESQMNRTLVHPRSIMRFADGHADICLSNEQQCLKGCDGATSCSKQCVANYDGCMKEGG
ncbi:MAG: hypothetical protein KGJ53_09305 [Alphaproteobacteria bacterium]|nr:hypothetical protein [Alphaproteobacteria bacterium]